MKKFGDNLAIGIVGFLLMSPLLAVLYLWASVVLGGHGINR